MHYCIMIISKEFPSDDIIRSKLAPYNEDDYYNQDEDLEKTERPLFLWDWYGIGGRYCGLLKLKINEENEEEYRWHFYEKEPRSGRLFRSTLLEGINRRNKSAGIWFKEEDIYPYLGYRDGYIRVDGCKVKDVVDFEEMAINHGWGFIGKNDEAYVREYWDGENWVTDEQYEEKVKEAIKGLEDCYVTYVDIHD